MGSEQHDMLRVPPAALDAEQAVIGGLLISSTALDVIDGHLTADDFYRAAHRQIFRAVADLVGSGQPCDVITVGEWLSARGLADQADIAYLIDVAAATPGVANIQAYARIVSDKAKQRRLIEIGTHIINAGYSPEGRSADDVVDDARRMLDGAQATAEEYGLCDVDLKGFMDTPASTIGWAIRPVVPRGEVTLWGGHGGAGKSISVLQLLAHGACGESWQGMEPNDYLRCLYVSLEDAGDKVRYRLRRICESYDLHSGRVESGVRVVDCPSGRASLMTEESKFGVRSMVETALLAQLRRCCVGADVIVIDNASDAFGGNENDRQAVRSFMSALKRIAREFNAGVILLAHVDKASAKTGAGGNTYSGSTAWHNSARSRIAIVTDTGVDGGPSTVRLVHEKNQYGVTMADVALRWNDVGVLMPLTSMDRAARAVDYTAQAYAVLVTAANEGILVPTATQGQRPSYRAVEHLPEYLPFTRCKGKQKQFHAELHALHQSGRIVKHVANSASRHPVEVWKLAEMPALNAALNSPESALNAAPNALNTPSPPPYKTPYGGFYMGGDSNSAQHSAHSAQHSAQGQQDDDRGGFA